MSDTIWGLSVTLVFLFTIFGRNLWEPFFHDYRFTEEGIDLMVLGGLVRTLRIKSESIREVTIMPALQVRLRHPFARNIGNRWSKRVLVVTTTGRASYMLTPAHGEDALRAVREMIRR